MLDFQDIQKLLRFHYSIRIYVFLNYKRLLIQNAQKIVFQAEKTD